MPLPADVDRAKLLQLRAKWLRSPLAWHHDNYPDDKLAPYQAEIFKSVRDNRMTFVHSAAGMGKDFIMARVMLWFFTTRFPAKIVGMGASANQIRLVLWSEIDSALRQTAYPFGLTQKFLELCLDDEKGRPFGNHWLQLHASRSMEAFQGVHLASPDGIPRVLVGFDEGTGVEDQFYDAAQSQADTLLAISNPMITFGWFAQQCELGDKPDPDRPGVFYRKVIHIDGLDSPNVREGMRHKEAGESGPSKILVPGILSYADYVFREAEWDDYNKSTRLHGRFYKGEGAQLFPAEWIERAASIFEEVNNLSRGPFSLGIDTASGGRDKAVFVVLDRLGIVEMIVTDGKDTTLLLAKTTQLMAKYHIPGRRVAVDAAGGKEIIGDPLAKRGIGVRVVSFGQSAKDKKRFKIARYEMYGRCSEAFDPRKWRKGKALGPDGNVLETEIWEECMSFDLHGGHRTEYEALREELIAHPMWHDEYGRLMLPPKQRKSGAKEGERTITIHDLLGRSPDRADALVLAHWARIAGRKVLPTVDRPMAYTPEDEAPGGPTEAGVAAAPAARQGSSLMDRLFGPGQSSGGFFGDWGD